MIPTTTIILKQYQDNGSVKNLEIPQVLIDTGASETYINKSIIPDSMNLERLETQESISNAFMEEVTTIRETLTANVFIKNSNIEIPKITLFVIETPMKFNAILGMNCLALFKIDFRFHKLKFINNIFKKEANNISTIIFEKAKVKAPREVLCQRETELSPHSNRSVYVQLQKDCTNFQQILSPEEVFLENNVFVTMKNNFWKNRMVTVHNRTNSVVLIEKGARFGFLRNPRKCLDLNFLLTESQLEPYERVIHKKELQKWRERRKKLIAEYPLDKEIEEICSKAPIKYKTELLRMLKFHQGIFSRTPSDAGLSQNYLTELKLKDNSDPVYTRPYKIDISMQESVEKKLADLKNAGIIEECCSAWNSPVLFVMKKDSSIRVVNNYSSCGDKSVNSRLIVPKYPSLPIRSVLSKISAAITTLKQRFPDDKIYFISLDVRNAFYSISIREKSRDITSFLFGGEQFRYQRMSQGLSSSPATFQYFINKVMTGTEGMNKDYFLVNYLDDFFVIVCERFHNKCVDKLLTRMSEENLVVALQKCEFFKTEAKFLGFFINESGIRADDMKVKALLELDYPKTQKEAQRFLGCLNYYSRLIPKMSASLSPLTKEIGKGKNFQLNETIIKGIDAVKDEIKKGVSVEHLRYPTGDENEFLFVAADTALERTGSIIGNLKKNGDIITNITIAGYASKALDEQEKLLSSRSRELIGLGYALKVFEDLIPKDRHFLLLCDHKSLEGAKHSCKLKGAGSSRVRLAFSRLLEYPLCTVHYVPGEHPLIGVADALSRLPVMEIGTVRKDFFSPENIIKSKQQINNLNKDIFRQQKPIVDIDCIKKHQKMSNKFSKIRSKLLDKTLIKVDNVSYTMHNDILYRSTKRGDLLAVVPKSLTRDFITFYHIATAHSGKAPIEEKLKNEPLWLENKNQALNQAIGGCLFCSLIQPSRFRSKSDLVSFKPTHACYTKVFIDLIELVVSDKLFYYLTFLDDFSLFLSVERVMSKRKQDVVPQLILLLSEFGCQGKTLVVSDNGGEFVNACLRDALDFMHIDHSFIAPYNSRANRVERAHRDLRGFIRTAKVKFSDANFVVKMSCHLYNHRSKEGLKGLTPAQVARNIDPPTHFGSLKITEKTGNFKDVQQYVEHLEKFHCELARVKREKYLIKEKKINELVKGDIIVLKKQNDILNSHRKENLGPYKVLEKRGVSAYLIEHLLLGSRLIRNRRYLVKIDVSPEDIEILNSKKSVFNSNHDILGPENDQSKITKSPLDLDILKSSLKTEEDHQETKSEPYKLRARKKINYPK